MNPGGERKRAPPPPTPHLHHKNNRRRLSRAIASSFGSNTVCYDAPKRFRDISEPPLPTPTTTKKPPAFLRTIPSSSGSNAVCYESFRDISQPPTDSIWMSWIFETTIFETTLCAPSPAGWGGLSGLGWRESVPNQESGACSACKGRGTITNHFPQPMVQLIEPEIRCLSQSLRLEISNLS